MTTTRAWAREAGLRTVLSVLVALGEDVQRERGLTILDEADHGVLVGKGHDRQDRPKDLLCREAGEGSSETRGYHHREKNASLCAGKK